MTIHIDEVASAPFDPDEGGLEAACTLRGFLPFHLGCVPRDDVASRLAAPLSEIAAPEHVASILREVRVGLLKGVDQQSYRTLIGSFHQFRVAHGLPFSVESDAATKAYTSHLRHEGTAEVLATHPVLAERISRLVDDGLAAVLEAFLAYRDDRSALIDARLTGEAGLTAMGMAGSDLHNEGRQVFFLGFADGRTLVYKPRSLEPDHFLAELFAEADVYLGHSLTRCVPRTVTKAGHGWQEHVEATSMHTPQQAARYYYRFGAITAILSSIGATDLHDENILARGESPCIVDSETVLRAGESLLDDSLESLLISHMKMSPASTMLVPMSYPGSPFDILMAGVGVAHAQESASLKRASVRNAGTDGVSVAWEPVVYRHTQNVPRVSTSAISAVDYFGDLQAGFRHGMRFVRSGKIAAVLARFSKMRVRTLLRSTLVYGKFIDASTHPDYLRDPDEADRLFRLLAGFSKGGFAQAHVDELLAAERAALTIGNVPYFTTRADGADLTSCDSFTRDLLPVSPDVIAEQGVALAASRNDAYHVFHLEECFGEIVDGRPRGLSDHSVFRSVLQGAGAGTWWPAVADGLLEVAVQFAGPVGDELGWIFGVGPDRGAPTLTSGSHVAFHDGGGIASFLRRVGMLDPSLQAAGHAADRGLANLLDGDAAKFLLSARPESLFSGSASLLLSRPDAVDGSWLSKLLDSISDRIAAGEADDDVANGTAGVLMAVLARLEAGEAGLCGSERIAPLVDTLLASLEVRRSRAWFDLAHGELGLYWALARAGRVLAEPWMTERAADWVDDRLRQTTGFGGPGWCNGSAGVLVAASEIAGSAGRVDGLVDKWLIGLVEQSVELRTDVPVDLSVCHGSSGVVQSLLAASRLLDEHELVNRAVEYQEVVLEVARRQGWSTGTAGRTSLIGYMLGWAGVGDSDALLAAALGGVAPQALPVTASALPDRRRRRSSTGSES